MMQIDFEEIQKKAERWDKLRTWLTNMMHMDKLSKSAKHGIQIALDVMDRLEENDAR